MNNKILGLFFPARCVVCGKVVAMGNMFCENCVIDDDKMEKAQCHKCGSHKEECVCNMILNKNKYHLISPFYYRDEARECVHQFKYSSSFDSGIFLAEKMHEIILKEYDNISFDIITCVPSTKRHRREKTFSTSEFLMKKIAKKMNMKSNQKVLIKIRETQAQVSLSQKERMINLKNAFAPNEKFEIKDKVILLCDDVRTTGATLNECAKALHKAGAKEVYCVTAMVTQKF